MRGRVRTAHEQHEAILDAFEIGALSCNFHPSQLESCYVPTGVHMGMDENLGVHPSMTAFFPSAKERNVFSAMLETRKRTFLGCFYRMKGCFCQHGRAWDHAHFEHCKFYRSRPITNLLVHLPPFRYPSGVGGGQLHFASLK